MKAIMPACEPRRSHFAKAPVQRAACATALLGMLAFWGGMSIAVRRYPSEYDWRYMPISNLLAPARNPAGYLWASWGVALCGLCGLCWAAVFAQRWKHASARDRPGGIRALQLGSFCMACSAVPPQWLLRIHKGHELIALLAFTGLCLGMVHLMFQTLERSFLLRMRGSIDRPRLYAAVLAGTAVFPILLAAFAQAYVFYVLPQLHWVSLAWRARGVPVYVSFAFWEWVTCAVISAYMALLALATHAVYRT
jgi:hypothetical protein